MDGSNDELRNRWHVIPCASFILFMELGVLKSYGVLVNDLGRDLGTNTWVIGLAVGLSHGIPALLAIVNGPLLQRFSIRQLIMTGSVVGSLGFVLSAFSQTGLQFVAALLISGLGYTLVLFPAQSCPVEYFPNHFAVASSIIVTGGGVGMMTLPILTEWFVQIYGWRGAVALIGALSLHSVVCGALMKPLKGASVPDSSAPRVHDTLSDFHTDVNDAECVPRSDAPENGLLLNAANGHSHITKADHIADFQKESSICSGLLKPVEGDFLNTRNLNTDHIGDCEAESIVCGALMKPPKGISAPDSIEPRDSDILSESNIDIQDADCDPSSDAGSTERTSTSVCDMMLLREKVKTLLGSISRAFDFRLLFDYPRMNSVLLTFLLFAITYNGWIVFLIPNGIAKGYTPSQAVLLATSGGLANILGRLLCGLFSSKQLIPDEILFCLVTTAEAVAFFANNVAYTFAVLTVLSVINGFCCGARTVMINLLPKSSVPAERVMAAMSFVFLVIGIAEPAGGFLLGFIFDLTGSYDTSFTVCGLVDMAAVIVLLIPWLYSVCSRRQRERDYMEM